MPHRPTHFDTPITNPRSSTYVAGAAASQGSAAEKRVNGSGPICNGHNHPGYPFIPALVEACGCLNELVKLCPGMLDEVGATRG